jgi:hypothetical protein
MKGYINFVILILLKYFDDIYLRKTKRNGKKY